MSGDNPSFWRVLRSVNKEITSRLDNQITHFTSHFGIDLKNLYNDKEDCINKHLNGIKPKYNSLEASTIRFIFEVEEGDILIQYPDNSSIITMIGRVGNYFFDPIEGHTRKTTWLKLENPIKIVDEIRHILIKTNNAAFIPIDNDIKNLLIEIFNDNDIDIFNWEIPTPTPFVNYKYSNTWIFQANPKRYGITNVKVSDTESWFVNNHLDKIKIGDRVFFWKSGENRGIYVSGIITSDIYELEEPNEFGTHMVDVIYNYVFNDYVSNDQLMEYQNLKNLNILKDSMGSIFSVNSYQALNLEILQYKEKSILKTWQAVIVCLNYTQSLNIQDLQLVLKDIPILPASKLVITSLMTEVREHSIDEIKTKSVRNKALFKKDNTIKPPKYSLVSDWDSIITNNYESKYSDVIDWIEFINRIMKIKKDTKIKYWMVNQRNTYKEEIEGQYLWSPLVNKRGGKNKGYTNMKYAKIGDIVFHNHKTNLRAISVVVKNAYGFDNPYDNTEIKWQKEGHKIELETTMLKDVIDLREITKNIKTESGAFQNDGKAKMSYFSPLNNNFIKYLMSINMQIKDILKSNFILKPPKKFVQVSNIISSYKSDLKNIGYIYSDKLIRRFIASLISKPFIILSGLSGSGKTKIIQLFAEWIGLNFTEKNALIIPVGADWTSNENIFGYPDAIHQGKYVKTPILNMILEAVENKNNLYILILDEMNLSHVERYFSDFLSSIESGKKIPLHQNDQDIDGIPNNINIPTNILIVGTVNIDETTYMFSPKVLDRAHVLEFNIELAQLKNFMKLPIHSTEISIQDKGVEYQELFLSKIKNNKLPKFNKLLKDELVLFFTQLQKIGAEFAYRTAKEMNSFIYNYIELGGLEKDAIDFAILQKLLPKLNGSRKLIENTLLSLIVLCWKGTIDERKAKLLNLNTLKFDPLELNNESSKYKYFFSDANFPSSFYKLQKMYFKLRLNGFVSFLEA